MIAEAMTGSILGGWIVSELASKAVSDGTDAIRNGIITAVKSKKAGQQNMQTRFYQVMVDTLKEFTYNRYKCPDQLVDAAECMLQGLLQRQEDDASAIKAGLKVLNINATDEICDRFVMTLISEICKDENNTMFKEADMLLKQQMSKDIRDIKEMFCQKKSDRAGVSLRRTNLSGANLAGADLAGANLARADLRGANLKDARFNE